MWFRKKEKKEEKDNKILCLYYGYPVYVNKQSYNDFPRGGGWISSDYYDDVRHAEEGASFSPSYPTESGSYSLYNSAPTGSAYNPYARYLNLDIMPVEEARKKLLCGNWEVEHFEDDGYIGKRKVQEVQYKCPYCRTKFTMPNDDTTNCPKCGGPQDNRISDDEIMSELSFIMKRRWS